MLLVYEFLISGVKIGLRNVYKQERLIVVVLGMRQGQDGLKRIKRNKIFLLLLLCFLVFIYNVSYTRTSLSRHTLQTI